jgi:hypothetical protein
MWYNSAVLYERKIYFFCGIYNRFDHYETDDYFKDIQIFDIGTILQIINFFTRQKMLGNYQSRTQLANLYQHSSHSFTILFYSSISRRLGRKPHETHSKSLLFRPYFSQMGRNPLFPYFPSSKSPLGPFSTTLISHTHMILGLSPFWEQVSLFRGRRRLETWKRKHCFS